MSRFYVYTLAYPECMGGQVFYVGKGTGARINDHERNAKKGVAGARYDIIRSLLEQGEQVVKSKVYEIDDEQEAYFAEDRLMREYGYDRLANRDVGMALMGNTNARGKTIDPSKGTVRVSFCVSNMLRDDIEACMEQDGIAYSEEACANYLKRIFWNAVDERIEQRFGPGARGKRSESRI